MLVYLYLLPPSSSGVVGNGQLFNVIMLKYLDIMLIFPIMAY